MNGWSIFFFVTYLVFAISGLRIGKQNYKCKKCKDKGYHASKGGGSIEMCECARRKFYEKHYGAKPKDRWEDLFEEE